LVRNTKKEKKKRSYKKDWVFYIRVYEKREEKKKKSSSKKSQTIRQVGVHSFELISDSDPEGLFLCLSYI
jgi:hypothetical protein